jgi:ABC-type phosphate/phosphonate transport system permease subunit
MSDVIFSIAIFHSLAALTLIFGSALSALHRKPRRRVIAQPAPASRAHGAPSPAVALPGSTPQAA